VEPERRVEQAVQHMEVHQQSSWDQGEAEELEVEVGVKEQPLQPAPAVADHLQEETVEPAEPAAPAAMEAE
jgi:hypothetical protein